MLKKSQGVTPLPGFLLINRRGDGYRWASIREDSLGLPKLHLLRAARMLRPALVFHSTSVVKLLVLTDVCLSDDRDDSVLLGLKFHVPW